MTEEIKSLKIMTSEMAQAKYMIEMATLRDQFAMAALTGLLSDPERDAEPSEAVLDDVMTITRYAECAYEYADAMFAAREQKK